MKPSALGKRITLDQRVRMVHDAQSLVEQYRSEMEAEFWPKRRRYERQENDDFSHRLSGDPSARRIFDLSNESLNLVRNVTRFMAARTKEDIFGSKPVFAIAPVGILDTSIADQLNRHAPFKMDQAQFSRIGKEGIGLALNLGETVGKTIHVTNTDPHEKLDLVLCTKKTGKPVIVGLVDATGAPQIDPDTGEQLGDYIYPEDQTVPEEGRVVYAKAPDVAVDDATEFREVLVEENTVTYHGPDVANVRFDAFIAPLNVPTLDDADCVCHEFSRTVSQLRALYGNPDGKNDPDLEALFEQLEQEPDGPKTAEDRPRETYGEVSAGRQRMQDNPTVKVQEIYLQGYDVFGDGVGRNVFVVLAADHDEPLYFEYLANMTVRGKLPFHPVPVNRVPGRWYGRGFYELYEHSQKLIDALINAILYRNENAADPLIAWQPDATEEGKTDRRLNRRPGKTITLRPGKSAKDAVQIIEFPDCDERTWQLVQLIMQLIQTDSGVTSAAQGDYSALPSASTATGVSSILQSASTLHRMLTDDLKDGFEPWILFAVQTIYAHQNQDETFQYLQGNAGEILSLSSARQLAQLELKVKLLLDRFQMREQREQGQLIIKEVLPQWLSALQASGLPTTDVAARFQPIFVQVAKGADIDGAEGIFELPQRPPPDSKPAPPKMTEAISLKGADLAPNQKDALAQQYGLPPAQLTPPAPAAGAPGAPPDPGAQPAVAGAPPDPAAPPALPSNVIPSAQPPPAPAADGTDGNNASNGNDTAAAAPAEGDDANAQQEQQQQPKPLDDETARGFLQQTGGDNDKARALAKKAGHALT